MEQSKQRSHRVATIDTSPGTHSFHPSSREGHFSARRRISIILLFGASMS